MTLKGIESIKLMSIIIDILSHKKGEKTHKFVIERILQNLAIQLIFISLIGARPTDITLKLIEAFT
jgi:hypothetical protein